MNNNFNNVFALPSRVIGSRMPPNTNNNDNSVLINSSHSHSHSSSRLNEEQQVSSRFTRYSTSSPAPHHTLTTSRQPRAYLHHQQRQQQLYSMHRNQHTNNNNNNKNNNHTSIYERTNIVTNNNNTVSPMITSHHPSMYAPSSTTTTTGASMTYGVHPYHQSSDRHAQQPQSMMYTYAPPSSSEMHMFNTSDYTPSPMPTHPHHASQHHDQRTMMMMMVPYPPTVAATTSTTPVPHHHHHQQQQQQLIHSSTTPIPSNVIQHQQQERRQQSSVVPMRSNSLIPIRVQAQYARQILLSPAPTLSSQSTIAMDHNSEQMSHVNTSRSMGDNINTTTTTTKQNRAAMMVPLAPLERQKAFEALSRQYIHKPLPKQSTTTTTTTIQNNQQQQPTFVIQSEEHVHSLLEESTSPSLPHVRQQEAVSTVAATTQEETFPQDRQSTTMMDVTTTITATTNMAQAENLEASAKTIRNWYCWFPYMTTFMNHNLHSKRRRHIHHYYDMILCGELEKDISNGGGDMMSNLDEHPKEWHSSIVMNRIHSHLLVTASGTSYRLYPDQCNFEKMCSRNTEVSLEFLQKFKRGVPEDWRQTVDYEYARLLNLDEFDYYSESDYEKNVDEGEYSNEKQQTTQDSIGNGTVEQFDNFDSFMRSMPSPPQDDDFSYYNNSETFGSAADDADDAHESQLGFGSTEDGQTYLEEHDGRRSADVVRSSIPSPPLIHDEDSEMHHEKEKKSPPSAPHRANPLHNKNLVLDESGDEGLYRPDTTEEEDDSDVDSDIGKQRRTTKKPKVSRYRKYESPSNTDESPSDQEDEEVEEGEEEVVEEKNEEPSEPITNQSQVVVIDPQQAGDILFDPSFAQVVTQPSQAPAKSLMAVNKKPTLTITRKRQRTDTTPNTVKKNKKRKEQTPSSQSTRSKHHHFVVAGTDTETESDDSDYNPDQPGYVRPFDARRNRKNRSKRMSISQ